MTKKSGFWCPKCRGPIEFLMVRVGGKVRYFPVCGCKEKQDE